MRLRSSVQATLGALLCMTLHSVARSDTQTALWSSQEIRFVYRSQLTLYECAALGEKVARILAAVGAHESTTLQFQSCNIAQPSGSSPAQVASMRINVLSAIPATPEARAALAKQSSRLALLDRLGVARPPSREFVAVWRSVDVIGERQLKLGSADCELVEQLNEQVLPKLAVKVLASTASCSGSPHRLRKPTLKVLALMPLPHADSVGSLGRDRR